MVSYSKESAVWELGTVLAERVRLGQNEHIEAEAILLEFASTISHNDPESQKALSEEGLIHFNFSILDEDYARDMRFFYFPHTGLQQ